MTKAVAVLLLLSSSTCDALLARSTKGSVLHTSTTVSLRAAQPLLALRGGFFSSLPAGYMAALASAPLATNMATAGTLSLVADGLAQRLTASSSSVQASSWDYPRSAWIVLWGTVVSGFCMSKWFALLARLYPTARTSNVAFALKLFTNQIFLSPGLNSGFFTFCILTRTPPVARMNAEKWAALKTKLRQDLLPTCMRSTAYWSVVQTLNFRVFPDHLTVISTNVFFLFWTIYLCIVGNRDARK